MGRFRNAFSANMFTRFPVTVTMKEITADAARAQLMAHADEYGAIPSVVGHADTAAVFSSILAAPVPCRRTTLHLEAGDEVILGQYMGPRLPENATTLPAGATIKWLHVVVGDRDN